MRTRRSIPCWAASDRACLAEPAIRTARRLDGPGDDYPPPLVALTAEQLAADVLDAAARVRYDTPPRSADAPSYGLRFGAQADARPVHGAANRNASRGDMHPQMVAAYIAKYATKAADDFGLDRRIRHLDHITDLAVSDHVRRIVQTAADIGAIRGERRAWRTQQARRDNPHAVELVDDDVDHGDSTLVIKTWAFVGMGWLSTGDAALAASAAARAREHRDTARDAVADQDDYDA